ncbi:hypothetical protein DB771_18930 [Burkholderia sp. AU29985]|nr:hypothetical protein C6P87_20745 [Burkholderia sp. AU12872]PUA75372.1 hypothetical protein DB771_18930 [Burkholderia sp. AU29985]
MRAAIRRRRSLRGLAYRPARGLRCSSYATPLPRTSAWRLRTRYTSAALAAGSAPVTKTPNAAPVRCAVTGRPASVAG